MLDKIRAEAIARRSRCCCGVTRYRSRRRAALHDHPRRGGIELGRYPGGQQLDSPGAESRVQEAGRRGQHGRR